MSRTVKDMPYHIRNAEWAGQKVPKDWRTRWGWRNGAFDYWLDLADGNRRLAWDMQSRDEPPFRHSRWQYSDVPSDFRRDLNRSYRAKTNQMVREERYDDIPKPVRNAAWLYW